MKFATKLTVSTVLLLALLLSFCGYFLVDRNFRDSLMSTGQRLGERQKTDAEMIKRSLYSSRDSFIAGRVQNYAIVFAGSVLRESSDAWFSIFADGTPVSSNFPEVVPEAALARFARQPEDSYAVWHAGESEMIFFSLNIDVPGREVILLSAFDISDLYDSRDGQLRNLLVISAVSLAAGLLLIRLMSLLLTRPLKRLQAASGCIASGGYSERTHIRGEDEIGDVSRSFDRMADAVEEKIGSLHESVRRREDFVLAFTHEIKTPMTSMMGYASLLRAKPQEVETVKTAANYIYHESKRLENLSQKLMGLMGLRAGELRMEAVSVSSLFASLRRTLPVSEPPVETDFEEGGGTVVCDRVLMEDLLRNLIVNAQKACREKGKVSVGCRPAGEKAEIFVADTGRGIPREEIPRITEPFYMVDKSRARNESGSGIGLALAQRIAEMHGAALHFDSAPDVGTVVSIQLEQEVPHERTAIS